MSIRITVAGIEKAVGEIREIPPEASRLALLRMSQVAYDSALRSIDSHSRTGALRRSLFNRAIPRGRTVGNDPTAAPHAVFVHWGTRPHVIRPRTKRALRWASGGGFVFAGAVNHPGYRGDAYIIKAADEAVRQFAAIIDRSFKDAAA